MSNKELFLSPNNLKENFQTVADEILKNTGYNISRHRSLETKFNSMAQIILNKTKEEEQSLVILNTKLQESSVTYFQKVIKSITKTTILPPQADPKSPQDIFKFGQDGSEVALRQPQDITKTNSQNFLAQSSFRLRFWSVLVRTWPPFDPSLGAQDEPKTTPRLFF